VKVEINGLKLCFIIVHVEFGGYWLHVNKNLRGNGVMDLGLKMRVKIMLGKGLG